MYNGRTKEYGRPPAAYNNLNMAAPLDGFDANTYSPRSVCLITPRSILDL
jgi:hypothetical protein